MDPGAAADQSNADPGTSKSEKTASVPTESSSPASASAPGSPRNSRSYGRDGSNSGRDGSNSCRDGYNAGRPGVYWESTDHRRVHAVRLRRFYSFWLRLVVSGLLVCLCWTAACLLNCQRLRFPNRILKYYDNENGSRLSRAY